MCQTQSRLKFPHDDFLLQRANMSAPHVHKPKFINLDLKQKLMQITWDDDHVSQYEFDSLRRACPCAECRPWTHGIGEPGETPVKVKTAVGNLRSPQDVSLVGAYAVNFRWADGHNTGIYTHDYLRGLCDCEEHRQALDVSR